MVKQLSLLTSGFTSLFPQDERNATEIVNSITYKNTFLLVAKEKILVDIKVGLSGY